MTPEEFQQLLIKYREGAITAPEKELLFKWLPVYEKQLAEQLDSDLYDPAVPRLGDMATRDIIYNAIQTAGDSDTDFSYPRRSTPYLGRRGWVAAAMLAGLVAVGAYFIVEGNKDQPVKVAAQLQDVAPGLNKATLILSDGSKVTLDSAGNQVIRQGAVAVQQRGGSLWYEVKEQGSVDAYNILATPRGGQFRVVLSDGTKVWLNAGSSIRYPVTFTSRERVVEVTGETYFEVAHDATAPFIVKTARQAIKVLGTRFNVNAYVDEPMASTTLLDGAVRITSGSANRFLNPGEQLTTQYASGEVAVRSVNVDNVVAWTDGKFRFDNSDIKAVMRQLARWYDVDVVYSGAVPSREFVGEIERDLHLSQVLNILEKNNIHFDIQGKKIIVLPE
ncbi:FecR family protein [Chitinophaga sp. 22321]|uniref:FecR domain-containing protein n=1 Tax=Chitinophaga hostae TaxID=2831022 RepID=A0ABS5IZM6_9BACT|nr:FecR family protein [Chitinophaga hostae]MBS0028236.1 FecR domain-containing protein [Chitinophaga hostae]